MVLAGGTDVRNGRRSRGPSPNENGSADSSSDDDNVVPFAAEKIRVGRDYQANVPDLLPLEQRWPELSPDRALLVWSPTADISDATLDEYISTAREVYGYNGEQALGMLFWHKHDLKRASTDLANFTPFPDEWTVEDKVLFEQAFQFHGKSFHRIRHMLPDKSVPSLVKYYYSWKKTRARTSLMDVVGENRTASTSSTSKRDSGAGSEQGGSDKESDSEEKNWTLHRGIARDGDDSPSESSESSRSSILPPPVQGESGAEQSMWCTVCGILCTQTTPHNSQKLCQACLVHARRTGTMRPLCGPSGRRGPGSKQQRYKHRLPRGIYINHDDLVAMATGPQPGDPPQPGALNQGEAMLKSMDREIITLKRQVQANKQQLSSMKRKTTETGVDQLRPGEPPAKINSRWTNDELLMAVTAVRKYGKDYQAIAETLGTKTEAHIRTFFVSYRRRYNLDAVIREHEAEKGNTQPPSVSTSSDVTDSDSNNTNGNSSSPQSKSNDKDTDVETKINPRWTNDELQMAVAAVKKFGKDYQAIAETIGTKTEEHVRVFFVSYRRRYNLDAVLREHEANNAGAKIQAGNTDSAEREKTNTLRNNASLQNKSKDDKEVDSEGVALGASAEKGKAPNAPLLAPLAATAPSTAKTRVAN